MAVSDVVASASGLRAERLNTAVVELFDGRSQKLVSRWASPQVVDQYDRGMVRVVYKRLEVFLGSMCGVVSVTLWRTWLCMVRLGLSKVYGRLGWVMPGC